MRRQAGHPQPELAPPLPYLPPSLPSPPFLGRGGIPGCPWDICLPEEGTSLTDTVILAACATSIFSKRATKRGGKATEQAKGQIVSLSRTFSFVSGVIEYRCRCFEGGGTRVPPSGSPVANALCFYFFLSFCLSFLVLPRGAPLFSVSLPAAVSV